MNPVSGRILPSSAEFHVALFRRFCSVSIMTSEQVDATNHERISALGQKTLDGGQLTREEAEWIFSLDSSADIYDLMAWGNRIREKFKGNKIHLCSIVNAKAGACSEDCKFCSQSAAYQTDAPRYPFVDPEPPARDVPSPSEEEGYLGPGRRRQATSRARGKVTWFRTCRDRSPGWWVRPA